MVNAKLKSGAAASAPRYGTPRIRGKPGVFTVNKSFSKSFEFAENSRRIRFECAQKPEQPLQPCLLVVRCGEIEQAAPVSESEAGQHRHGTGVMFFLLRVAFWLTVVLVLLPSGGGAQQSAQAKVGAADAVVAASAAVSDMSGFCGRQPDACTVGAQAAVVIGQRAKAGAKMVYDFINDHAATNDHVAEHAAPSNATGSVTKTRLPAGPKIAAAHSVPSSPGSQNTLKDSDLAPAWQGPMPVRSETVPLPRKAPHRKV
jgi:hypothetical protein